MPGLLIKDLPPELHVRLKQEAARHHRSMTRQELVLLEQDQTGTAQEVQATPDLTLSMQGFLEQAQPGNT